MWSSFCIAFFLVVVAFYLPGYLVFRSLSLSRSKALAAAPIVSLFLYDVMAFIYAAVGIFVSYVTLVGVATLIAFSVFLLTFFIRRKKSSESGLTVGTVKKLLSDFSVPLLYVAVSLVLVVYFFLVPLDGPSTFFQGYDTVFHFNLMKSFSDSGIMSSLTSSLYLDGSTVGPYTVNGGFYPSSWHCISAIALQIVGGPASLAANAENAVIVAFVFPLGVMLLLEALFPSQRKLSIIGAFASLSFVDFPWTPLIRGEQFPQMLSFALLPIVCALFVMYSKSQGKQRVIGLLLMVVSLVSLGVAQTNVVFSSGIFVVFYASSLLATQLKSKSKSFRFRLMSMGCYFLVCALLWLGAYKLPFLNDVVSFSWDSFASKTQAVLSVLTMDLNWSAIFTHAPQYLLGFIVLVGVFESLVKRKDLWLTGLFAFVSVCYIVDVSSDGTLKHLLTGFWYTDPARVSSMLAIFSVPLACKGVLAVVDFCSRLAKFLYPEAKSKVTIWVTAGVLLLSVNFCPSFDLAEVGFVETPFGGLISKSILYASGPGPYDKTEQQFVDKAVDYIPKGALVIGCPFDGSSFCYGINDLNMYYRRDSGGEFEKQDSWKIRTGLNRIDEDSSVRDAITSIDAEYVLLLDCYTKEWAEGLFLAYKQEDWSGILSIDESTPGFELVCSEGDMRLYKIV